MNTTDLTERDYSRQSHLIVNSKYAMTSNEINPTSTCNQQKHPKNHLLEP